MAERKTLVRSDEGRKEHSIPGIRLAVPFA
jgi:hypothetical protein